MTTKQQDSVTDSFNLENDDVIQCEGIIGEGSYYSLPEGEEDFEATLMANKQRSEGIQAAATTNPNTNTIPEAVDDYVRNFLLRMGMTKTLDCFQVEWNEMLQKGLLDTELVGGGAVPDVYAQNRRLDDALRRTHAERDRYRTMASSLASETLTGLQKARDFHRMQHKRVLQEKNRLVEDMRKLKIQCGRYEPAVRQLDGRCQSMLRQKTLVTLERDRALAQVHHLQATLHNLMGPSEETETETETKTQRPNQDTGEVRRKTKSPSNKKDKHVVARDSKFPACRQGSGTPPSTDSTRSADSRVPATVANPGGFQLRSTIKAHGQSTSCLARHPTKPLLASSGDDQLWKLWGLPGAGDLVARGEGHTDWLSGVTFHPDATRLGTTGGDASVRIWDLSEGRLVLSLRGHSGVTWACSFHSCGDVVASCSIDCTIKVWDLQSKRCRSTLRGHRGSVNSVEFLASSSSGNTLLSASADKTLSLWDTRSALRSQTIRGHSSPLNAATVCPLSSSTIASCDSCGVIMLWDTRNLVAPATVVETGPRPSNQVAFDPLGKMLAVAGDDGSARVIDLSARRVAGVLAHDAAVQSVVFDHKGECLLSGASDGQIYVWSVST